MKGREGLNMNLEGWKYLLTFGHNLDIYGKGKRRVGVIRDTGQMLIGYKAAEWIKVNRGNLSASLLKVIN